MSKNKRKGCIYPVAFESPEEKEAYMQHAKDAHQGLKLAQLIRKLLKLDKDSTPNKQ